MAEKRAGTAAGSKRGPRNRDVSLALFFAGMFIGIGLVICVPAAGRIAAFVIAALCVAWWALARRGWRL